MRLLVCGDRNWNDYGLIKQHINQLLNVEVIIEGDARGADKLAGEVATELKIELLKIPAKWGLYKRAAGPIRNIEMLNSGKPDFVLAFHDDIEKSKGTKHMISIALKASIPVYVITQSKVITYVG